MYNNKYIYKWLQNSSRTQGSGNIAEEGTKRFQKSEGQRVCVVVSPSDVGR